MQTADYPRMRVGIGNNFSKGHQVDFVLGEWGNYENEQLPKILKHCVGACKTFGFLGLEKTMSEFNKKILNSDPPQNTSDNNALPAHVNFCVGLILICFFAAK